MNRIALLAATLLTVACADVDVYQPKPRTLWLQPADVGYAEQSQWGMPLPTDFEVEAVSGDEVRARCGSTAVGGAYIAGCAGSGGIVIRDDLSDVTQHLAILHEIGHLLGASHIVDPIACPEDAAGEYVMCAIARHDLTELAPADFTMLR